MVEVAFTVSPRVRRIAAHDPNSLSPFEYYRQVFWSSGVDLPDDGIGAEMEEAALDILELLAGQKALLTVLLPEGNVVCFEPVTHAAHFILVPAPSSRASATRPWRRSRRPIAPSPPLFECATACAR